MLLPISPAKIKREYHILKSLNHPNVIKIIDIVKCSHLKTASLITENFNHDDFRELYPKLTLPDIKFYLKQLLEVINLIIRHLIMSILKGLCIETSNLSTFLSTTKRKNSNSLISGWANTIIPQKKTTQKLLQLTTKPQNSTFLTLSTTIAWIVGP